MTQFSVATNAYRANGQEKSEFHSVVTWDRLAGSLDGVEHITLGLEVEHPAGAVTA